MVHDAESEVLCVTQGGSNHFFLSNIKKKIRNSLYIDVWWCNHSVKIINTWVKYGRKHADFGWLVHGIQTMR